MTERDNTGSSNSTKKDFAHETSITKGWSNERYEIIFQQLVEMLDKQFELSKQVNDNATKLVTIELTALAAVVTAIEADLISVGSIGAIIATLCFIVSITICLFFLGGDEVNLGPNLEHVNYLMHYEDEDKGQFPLATLTFRDEKLTYIRNTELYENFHSNVETWDEHYLGYLCSLIDINHNFIVLSAYGVLGAIILFLIGLGLLGIGIFS